MKDSLRRESVVDIQDDGDPYWFNNPQYRLSADEPVEVGRASTNGNLRCDCFHAYTSGYRASHTLILQTEYPHRMTGP